MTEISEFCSGMSSWGLWNYFVPLLLFVNPIPTYISGTGWEIQVIARHNQQSTTDWNYNARHLVMHISFSPNKSTMCVIKKPSR